METQPGKQFRPGKHFANSSSELHTPTKTATNRPTAGFYVHYHGLGHKHRTESILRAMSIPATVVTSRLGQQNWQATALQEVVSIACDIDDVCEAGLSHAQDVDALHYAPLWCKNITKRIAEYSNWLHDHQPDVMIVDVSAEISMLTRLASIPQIVMRQHGDRSDPAHTAAYSAAHSLLAPFPRLMEDDLTPEWVRKKTVYLDGFCRNQNIGSASETEASTQLPQSSPSQLASLQTDHQSANPSRRTNQRPRIAVMFGRGGTADRHQQLRDAASAMPDYDWQVVGKSDDENHDSTPENLDFIGWVDRPEPLLRSADLVVTSAGHNSVMELGNARCRTIAIAEERPFEEQVRKAIVLNREGLAVGLTEWPATGDWQDVIEAAKRLDVSRWDSVFSENGAVQAARHIEEVAQWSLSMRTADLTPPNKTTDNNAKRSKAAASHPVN